MGAELVSRYFQWKEISRHEKNDETIVPSSCEIL